MAIQDEFGRIGFFEEFGGYVPSTTVSDATVIRYNDLLVTAVSGDTIILSTVDESGGVISINGAGGAGDGLALIGLPMQPSTNGTIRMGARFKGASATDLRVFVGFAETVAVAEPVNPFTLSGSTLTSNDAGNAVGFYTDTAATDDDFRFHYSLDGTESTTAPLYSSLSGATTLGALGIRSQCTLTADSWYVARVEIDTGGGCIGYFGGPGMANQSGLTKVAHMKPGTFDQTALVYPVLYLLASSTGDPLLECDYIWAKGNRDWAT